MTHQCKSCGGFCGKSGCERRDSIVPCKHFRSGLTNKTAAECQYCEIERLKSEIHELQCQQDTPLAFYDISHDEDGEVEYEFSVYPRPGFKPLYTQAVAQAAQPVQIPGWQPIESAPKDTALLLYCGSFYEIGHFNTAIGEWVCGWDHRKLKPPTHWMPLPAAPATKEQSNG